jgi:hypothetical protein
MAPRSHPDLLRAAVGYANQGIPVLPDQLAGHPPELAGPPVCACRRRDCPAPALHQPGRLDRQQSIRQVVGRPDREDGHPLDGANWLRSPPTNPELMTTDRE